MAKQRDLQDKVKVIDDAISDKGTVNVSMKSVKWIVGSLIGLSLMILGVAWGFKINLETSFEKSLNNTKTVILEKVDDVEKKVDELEKEDVKPNTKINAVQNGDIKTLYEITDMLEKFINGYNNYNAPRPNNLNNNPGPSFGNNGRSTLGNRPNNNDN